MSIGQRVSTAGEPARRLTDLMLGELPSGVIMNLGAGGTGHRSQDRTVVNVDHTPPSRPSMGHFVVADGHALPFRTGGFSGVLMKDVLEHLADPICALKEAHRVASPDAVLIMTTPRAIARAVWDDPTHVRGFTARALLTALSLAGWTPLRPPRRHGALPGAGRLRLERHVEQLLRVPGIGHWYGTNWIVRARAAKDD